MNIEQVAFKPEKHSKIIMSFEMLIHNANVYIHYKCNGGQ